MRCLVEAAILQDLNFIIIVWMPLCVNCLTLRLIPFYIIIIFIDWLSQLFAPLWRLSILARVYIFRSSLIFSRDSIVVSPERARFLRFADTDLAYHNFILDTVRKILEVFYFRYYFSLLLLILILDLLQLFLAFKHSVTLKSWWRLFTMTMAATRSALYFKCRLGNWRTCSIFGLRLNHHLLESYSVGLVYVVNHKGCLLFSLTLLIVHFGLARLDYLTDIWWHLRLRLRRWRLLLLYRVVKLGGGSIAEQLITWAINVRWLTGVLAFMRVVHRSIVLSHVLLEVSLI